MARIRGQDHGRHSADLLLPWKVALEVVVLPGLPCKVVHPDPFNLEADVLPGLLASLTDPLHRDLFKGKGQSKDKRVKGPIWNNLDLRIKTLQQEQQHL